MNTNMNLDVNAQYDDVAVNLKKLFSLENKIVLLTGAAGGIGSVLAKGLAGVGAKLALCDISADGLASLKDELCAVNCSQQHESFVLDLQRKDDIDACVDSVLRRFGRVDILINGAGINKREGFLDVCEETYDKIMNINLKSLFFLSQSVVRKSMMKTGGKIINIASFNSTSMLGGVSVYGAAKSAVAALTRSMALEWARYNIQANAVAPGHILTPLTKVTWDNERRAAYLRERITMERPGEPHELIGIIVMLASASSSYMTGQLYNVDGGALAGGKPWDFDTKY